MKKQLGNTAVIVAVIVGLIVMVLFSSYNGHVSRDENVTAQWSEVTNQYQRRADLIPNLVNVVKGYAAHEKDTLTAVIQARSTATSMKIDPSVANNAEALANFQKAQSGLSQALSRLMVVVEKYPDLKANENFRDLQSQIEGTENRITVARKRYIEAVQAYNTAVRQFPGKIAAYIGGFSVKPNFSVENENTIKVAPVVKF